MRLSCDCLKNIAEKSKGMKLEYTKEKLPNHMNNRMDRTEWEIIDVGLFCWRVLHSISFQISLDLSIDYIEFIVVWRAQSNTAVTDGNLENSFFKQTNLIWSTKQTNLEQ